jgi:iron-sulfur cluster protein
MGESDRAAAIRQLLATEGPSVESYTKGFNRKREAAVADLQNYEELRDRSREIKEDAIDRLPALIEELREAVEDNGGHLYLADDAADANRYIREVAADADAERVVKSKSMTTEELEVNDALAADGLEVIETDLGEWVVQLADETPSHLIAPAIHRSRESIAELLNERFEPDTRLETADELTAFARERLGESIRDADVGMTGINFVAADTGTMALVTSEGNARKCVVAPDVHVAVGGVEKVIPSVDDLPPFLELIARSGTGQELTSYVSLFTPPVEAPTVDFDDDETPLAERGCDDREFHLVLVDNGRMAMREDDQLRETLYCIRCGACSNSCANFQHVGGHAFGGETYSGGIATGWEAGIEGLDVAAEFNDLCTGCSRCVDGCPTKIDIPWINTVVRDRINRGEKPAATDVLVEGLTPDAEPGGLDPGKRLFGNFETLAKLGSKTAPVSNWLASTPPARWALERVAGVDSRRELPTFERETLVDWANRRVPTVTDSDREAVLYPDIYTNHVQVDRGKAAVRALEALGVSVRVPPVRSSGRAPLSQGMIATAEGHAHDVYADLAEHLDADRDVVVIEPSDLAMIEREYERFLPDASVERLQDGSYEIMEYVHGLLANDADPDALVAGDDDGVAYHAHCQQRTLDLAGHTTAVLTDLGYDVVTSDVECCGMAGSFGYKRDYYELSVDVGDDLAEQFSTAETRDRALVASGTSCIEQLDALLSRPTRHPIELIAPP